MNHQTQQFELLLPAGTKEMALAALQNGADAIYIGVPGFNARGRSHDFDLTELKEIIQTFHLYGKKVYLAFNVVIFECELIKASKILIDLLKIKPDAMIVQDLGLANLIRKISPSQRIHASTQMTVTCFESIKLVEDLGIGRFVLGRENSLHEIELIRQKTHQDLEVFVHGALCVSYSGQCFTSESIGGRSANRGQCAQSCRFSYQMIVDGKPLLLGSKNFLLSPQDLCGINEIPSLMKMGVKSFKVEGRLKAPEYVAAAARSYREAIDKTLSDTLPTSNFESFIDEMSTTYSRGFTSGWLHGVDHQTLVEADSCGHRGLEIGKIVQIGTSSFTISLLKDLDLENGDGILWVTQSPEHSSSEFGSFLFDVKPIGHRLVRVGVDHDIKLAPFMLGSRVFFNHDRSQKQILQKSWTDRSLQKKIPLSFQITLERNKPLIVVATDGHLKISSQSQNVLTLAAKGGLTDQALCAEIQSLGGTLFTSQAVSITRSEPDLPLYLPPKEIKEIRRQLCDSMQAARIAFFEPEPLDAIAPEEDLVSFLNPSNRAASNQSDPVEPVALNVLLRNRDQVDFLLRGLKNQVLNPSVIGSILLDFEYGRDLAPSLQKIKSLGLPAGLATTRIHKPHEYANLKALDTLAPDLILIRNLGALYYFNELSTHKPRLLGDFSLNVTNHLTANYLLSKGLESVCLSYDLSHSQVSDLLVGGPAERMEVTLHQSMPSFHMEHCVFAANLSQGHSWRDCGKPCEKHRVELIDQFGNSHHIKADPECRNTMYNARSQTAARFVDDWKSKGLLRFRYEALHEDEAELIQKIKSYQLFLEHQINLDQLLTELRSVESYGLAEGSLSRTKEYQPRKKSPL